MHHSNTEEAVDDGVVGVRVAWWILGLGMVDTPCSVRAKKISFVELDEEVDEKEASLWFQKGVGMALDVESLQKQKETLFLMKEVEETFAVENAVTEEGISQPQELVWGEWFNAIPAGWGPGSPVWDDLDPNNNLLLHSQLPFVNPNQQEFHDAGASSRTQQEDNNTEPGSSSPSCPMRPFF